MNFYVTDYKNRTFALPLNPEKFEIAGTHDDKTVSVIRLGEISILGDEKLKSIEITSTIPVKPEDEHYTSTDQLLGSGQEYLDKLNAIYNGKHLMRLVISDTKINFQGYMREFKIGMSNAYDGDWVYTFKVNQYKAHKAIKVGTKKKKKKQTGFLKGGLPPLLMPKHFLIKKGTPRSAPPNKVGRGSFVFINGKSYRKSSGGGVKYTERDVERKISLVAPGTKYPYHIVSENGASRGWISASSIKG